MKTIIIPAYRCDSAINLFKLSLEVYGNEPVTCWFLDVRPVPGNYNDLLTLGRTASKPCAFDAAFRKEIDVLIKRQEDRVQYRIDHIYGDSSYVFRNYLQFREANLVIYDKKEWQNSKKETGLNIFRMVSQCGCELMYVSETSNLVSRNTADREKGQDHNARETASTPAPDFTNVPASLRYQFQAVDRNLVDLEKNMKQQRMVSIRLNNLSRYFLKETSLQKMMIQSNCSLLLLQK